jgi:hypothetical protein
MTLVDTDAVQERAMKWPPEAIPAPERGIV